MSFKLIYKLQKAFDLNNIPSVFKNLNLPSGNYFWGLGSVGIVDKQGELIEPSALRKRARDYLNEPYNKVFLNHKHDDIAAGTIVYSEYIDNLKDLLKNDLQNFNELPEEGHLILGKANEFHPLASNIWGSISNGAIGSWSLYGENVKRTSVFNKESGKYENHITDFEPMEATITSIPINPAAKMYGAFAKGFAVHVSEEQKKGEKQMTDENYVTKEMLEKSFNDFKEELKNTIKESMDIVTKSVDEKIDSLKKSSEVKKAEVGDACKMPDGSDGEMRMMDGEMKCMAKSAKKAEESKEPIEKAMRKSTVKKDEVQKETGNEMPILNFLTRKPEVL